MPSELSRSKYSHGVREATDSFLEARTPHASAVRASTAEPKRAPANKILWIIAGVAVVCAALAIALLWLQPRHPRAAPVSATATTIAARTPQPLATVRAPDLVIPSGAHIRLRLSSDLAERPLQAGQEVTATVYAPTLIADAVALPVGTRATLRVLTFSRTGVFRRTAKLGLTLAGLSIHDEFYRPHVKATEISWNSGESRGGKILGRIGIGRGHAAAPPTELLVSFTLLSPLSVPGELK